MNKSKIPDICIWVLYALATCASLVLLAFALSARSGYITVAGIVGAVVTALLPGASVVWVHKLVQKEELRRFFAEKRTTCVIVEALFFVAMLVGMLLLRPEVSWNVAGDAAYKAAQVTPGEFYVIEPHGGYRVYLYLLNFALLLFGNRPFGAIVLQLVLLICAVICMYFGVRKLAGPVAALMATAFLGFAPYMLEETSRLNGFLTFLFCYGIALNFIGGIANAMANSKRLWEQIFAALCYVAAGIFVGFSCYLDVAGITLLVILTGVICFDGTRQDDEIDYRDEETIRPGSLRAFEKWFEEVLSSPAVVFIGIVLVAVIAFWRMHGEFASLFRQLSLCVPKGYWFYIPTAWNGGLLDMVLVNALLVFGCVSFWCTRSLGKRGVWIFAAMLMAVGVSFGMSAPDYFGDYAFLYLLCVILAGAGIEDAFARKLPKVERVKAEKKLFKKKKTEDALTENIVEQPPESTVDSDNSAAEEERLEPVDITANMPKMPTINFIENPLPLPKKHERKIMDYDYEVAEDDDFDIPY